MEVTVERIETEVKKIEDRYELFDVHIGDKRILTLFTDCDSVMKKWVSELRKANREKKKPDRIGSDIR
ncbi:hypothetical protein AQUCO_00300596v1 [Aquilegia coerulea]|uniref:PH domain-containing protein n=1 Tax=Aquilegia coerulea TaxID=218851 RepID=A0A2G5EZI2_AQUCA|nr:hypothetical protein AQUCO_09600036v1 [Aquilegia coerulea]PIA61175.1 hypothetical protein AQUCO_00300596v1 [Aquilegia coerulea]